MRDYYSRDDALRDDARLVGGVRNTPGRGPAWLVPAAVIAGVVAGGTLGPVWGLVAVSLVAVGALL